LPVPRRCIRAVSVALPRQRTRILSPPCKGGVRGWWSLRNQLQGFKKFQDDKAVFLLTSPLFLLPLKRQSGQPFTMSQARGPILPYATFTTDLL
jgi:hypothetical protein